MKKERRRGRGGGEADDARATPPLARADVDALRFCLDALSDGLDAGGVSPAAALEPWTAMAAAVESHVSATSANKNRNAERPTSHGAFLLECGTRAAAAAARRASRVLPAAGSAANDGAHREDGVDDDDAAEREDLAEGLRDVAAVVGVDVFVAVVVDGAEAAVARAVAAARDADGNVAEGWIFALFAVARLTTASPDAASTAARAVHLARGVMDARLSTRASELATWIISGLSRALSSPSSDAATLDVAVAAVAAGLESNDHAVARGACVAAMRLCETCGAALASDDPRAVRTRAMFAGWYARGGPAAPAPSALRRGQEPVTTVLARGLAAVAKARHPASEAERECVALAEPAVETMRRAAAATRDAAERAAALDADPSASHDERRRSLVAVADAALALRIAVVETHALVSACVSSAERALSEGAATAGDATDDATATRIVAAAAEALVATATAGAGRSAPPVSRGAKTPARARARRPSFTRTAAFAARTTSWRPWRRSWRRSRRARARRLRLARRRPSRRARRRRRRVSPRSDAVPRDALGDRRRPPNRVSVWLPRARRRRRGGCVRVLRRGDGDVVVVARLVGTILRRRRGDVRAGAIRASRGRPRVRARGEYPRARRH